MHGSLKDGVSKVHRIALGFLFLLALSALAFFTYEKYMYPFGHRLSAVRCLQSALFTYASEHFGKFPDSAKGPYDALQQIFPEYTPSGVELAGISGDADRVVKALHAGKKLDSKLTSWVYVPGLRWDDNPQLALLWESKGGLYATGKRISSAGHTVLLVGSDITNVSEADWTNFLAQQEKLRKAAALKHAQP